MTPTTELTGQDALLLLLIADAEPAGTTFVSKLMDEEYTLIGASIVADPAVAVSPEMILTVMIDEAYRNA